MLKPCKLGKDGREKRERKYRLRGGKPRTTRFIPDADSEFARMARCFAGHVARHADRFGASAERVEELSIAVTAFRDALSRTLRHSSAGPSATRTKNETRKRAETVVRSMARFLRGLPEGSITSVDRLNLFMPEQKKRAKRLECPQIAPILKFLGSTDPSGTSTQGGRHILEFRNDFDRASTARPHGAARLELFVDLVRIDEPIPAHPGQRSGGRLWYLRSYTTNRFEVEFPRMFDGDRPVPMLVVYWGRWADSSGGVGPFSKTCVAQVENTPYGLPHGGARGPKLLGGRRNPVHAMQVTQMRGEIEALPGGERPLALPGGCESSAIMVMRS